ncbi:MAG: diaminopimelate decarboxylase [Clostridia bacterium]|nr:diaminopimelate decarboxylase [Clostridia bacterium]
MLHPNLSVNEKGHLTIGGIDAVDLAAEFGTPAYIIDEDMVRENCRTYRRAMTRCFGDDSRPLYASKALCCAAMYHIAREEGLGIDCVSGGELYTAKYAGFPAGLIYFHGNNKTDRDLRDALDMGVGTIVVDNEDELRALSALAAEYGVKQKILLRISPGIDPHTHRAISTGSVDSKFGRAIETGQARAIVEEALALPDIDLAGFHCHIGSQIFEIDPFVDAAAIMTAFIADMKRELGFDCRELNLGGGFGVRYTEFDPVIDYADAIERMAVIIRRLCDENGIPMPSIRLEPGRSLVAAAGTTLYTVGSFKEIPGFKRYISIDGGMPDNPRYALYGSRYTALIANRAAEEKSITATIAGRCCESGDLIGEDMPIQPAQRGDILAVLSTGAYNYSMASNYNRLPRPPIVLISGGKATLAVRRETYADLVALDLF